MRVNEWEGFRVGERVVFARSTLRGVIQEIDNDAGSMGPVAYVTWGDRTEPSGCRLSRLEHIEDAIDRMNLMWELL
jgi:hypothetical protein